MKLTSLKYDVGIHQSSRFASVQHAGQDSHRSLQAIGMAPSNESLGLSSLQPMQQQPRNQNLDASNFVQPSAAIIDMKDSSEVQLQERRDRSTKIRSRLTEASKMHQKVRKTMLRQVREDAKFREELLKDVKKQTKYLDVLSTDRVRKHRQELRLQRVQGRLEE